jgi:hypothetical protein
MSQATQLRQRIEWLKDALATCQDRGQRETLIGRLLDTQDQLMFLNMAPTRAIAYSSPPRPRRTLNWSTTEIDPTEA